MRLRSGSGRHGRDRGITVRQRGGPWDGNGRYEFARWDSNEDGVAEYVCQDLNNDGYAETWTTTAQPTRPTANDQWAKLFINASNNRLASIWLS